MTARRYRVRRCGQGPRMLAMGEHAGRAAASSGAVLRGASSSGPRRALRRVLGQWEQMAVVPVALYQDGPKSWHALANAVARNRIFTPGRHILPVLGNKWPRGRAEREHRVCRGVARDPDGSPQSAIISTRNTAHTQKAPR